MDIIDFTTDLPSEHEEEETESDEDLSLPEISLSSTHEKYAKWANQTKCFTFHYPTGYFAWSSVKYRTWERQVTTYSVANSGLILVMYLPHH